MTESLIQAAYLARGGPLHPRPAGPHRPRHRAPRHEPGRARHARGRRRHAAAPRHRPLRVDPGRRRGRLGGRRRHGDLHADDGDAAADRPLARLRRARRHAGGRRRVRHPDGRRRARPRAHGRDRLRGDVRLAHHHRQLDGLRQAAGADAGRADHLSRPERDEHRALRAHLLPVRLPDRRSRRSASCST